MDAFTRKLLYPSGLTDAAYKHSDKCGNPDNPCTCSRRRATAKALSIQALLKSKEWSGSTVSRAFHKNVPVNKLTHPSGAVAYLYLKGGG